MCLGDDEAPNLAGHRVLDLYLKASQAHRLNLVDTVAIGNGIIFTGGTAYQHPLGTNLQTTDQDVIDLVPCIVFDSFIALGGTDQVSFIGEPATDDWGSGITSTLWFTTSVVLFSDTGHPFNDGQFYARIMRITLSHDAHASGVVEVGVSLFNQGTSVVTEVTVPKTPLGTLVGDIDGDCLVNSADLNLLLLAFGKVMGQPGYAAAADLDADGVVGSADLNELLAAFGDVCPGGKLGRSLEGLWPTCI